jgi:hypothetical protein
LALITVEELSVVEASKPLDEGGLDSRIVNGRLPWFVKSNERDCSEPTGTFPYSSVVGVMLS